MLHLILFSSITDLFPRKSDVCRESDLQSQVAKAPDGNGGVYAGFHLFSVLELDNLLSIEVLEVEWFYYSATDNSVLCFPFKAQN